MEGDRVSFDRPLRCDVHAVWRPQLRSFEPTVTESGVENLCFEFPNQPYKGHFTELGFNAIAFAGVADCWVRNVRTVNADSGLFIGGSFNTLQGVVLESQRDPDRQNCFGHHGISLGGGDHLVTNFDFRTRYTVRGHRLRFYRGGDGPSPFAKCIGDEPSPPRSILPMKSSICDRAQYSMWLVPGLAFVAQVSNLKYRRFPIGRALPVQAPQNAHSTCGLKTRDTADWKSALRYTDLAPTGTHERACAPRDPENLLANSYEIAA